MRESRFADAKIIGLLIEQEAGLPTVEICRKHGLITATFYKMKAKYGGIEVSDARRLRHLEDENSKLKRLMADSMLDNATMDFVADTFGASRRLCILAINDDAC